MPRLSIALLVLFAALVLCVAPSARTASRPSVSPSTGKPAAAGSQLAVSKPGDLASRNSLDVLERRWTYFLSIYWRKATSGATISIASCLIEAITVVIT